MDASSAPLFQKILLDLDRLGKIDWSSLTRKQFKVLSDIMKCHTEACGMNCDVCEECGFTQYHYCSCNNPNCPLCGALGRERWVENQRQYVLNERYYHMVFTIPHELNWLCLLDPEQMYRRLFKAVSSVLLEAGRDPEFLGGQAGFTCVLHTWGQKMDLHPHIHVIFCGGVAADQQTWQRPRRKNGFLYPVAKLRSAFKRDICLLFAKNLITVPLLTETAIPQPCINARTRNGMSKSANRQPARIMSSSIWDGM